MEMNTVIHRLREDRKKAEATNDCAACTENGSSDESPVEAAVLLLDKAEDFILEVSFAEFPEAKAALKLVGAAVELLKEHLDPVL